MTQLQMIDKTKYIAQQDENVSAVFMYGSFTKNEGDKYSDIEFYIFLKNKENFSTEKWVNQIHPLALYFTNEYGSEVAIFENMVRGEFHFLKTEEIEIIKSWDGIVEFSDFDQMNLTDKDGLLTKTLNQIKTKSPERITNENILWLSQSLLNVVLTTSNLIKREEFAHAHHSLSNVQKYLLWLIRARTSKTQHWESPTKSLEKDIDTIWYSEYKKVTSDLNPKNIVLAFENSLNLSEKLFDELNIEPKLKEILHKIR
ncbi:aminoglycoside 6-adenylyltransferase [Riemerella anatipestifer]|jgi:lincosamide nucleotidyltransferase|uniref:Lincosamide nucleotidyltransferase n=6 Tax=Flavobacteriales TaxID=200644 RepID=A0A1H6MJ73_9FLAO|nr:MULTISPECIES: lincosamide nucleotidyltransferase Lnu(H) [Bacteroidota]MBS1643167.1 aminoglycoside 6-adenylyltransferase [Bacteroidota bacterium]MBS1648292.1 aminoglycoside 6-adenylyltransferase [Bacteroidota bacterium]MBT0526930.1 aminoglycoside 6-adenylyltransferase [Riemerella anatipestifer]MBT0528890.1 aminoglycoside 6-adenylyltransferase [Riemerella anatipestifer]MBT0530808.1 aminoglycoside 6-adenylyltransferase [Riemerella anatipestifer]